MERADLVIVGAGAAGLMAAIWAGRSAPGARIIALDGARSLGAKILVAGGGRCNVTHFEVDERAYAGAPRPMIAKVLRRFPVPRTVAVFEELGVTLKQEDTGKLFPTTDRARDVLAALLRAARDAGAEIRFPWRVGEIVRDGDGFIVREDPRVAVGEAREIRAARVVLASGGMALPKTGSDGAGYPIAHSLGHSLTPAIFPALAPLLLPRGHFLTELSGLAAPATVEVRSSAGKRLASFTNALLCTHFGLSGPAALDISRYWTAAHQADPDARFIINWLPGHTPESFDKALLDQPAAGAMRPLRDVLPERLAKALLGHAQIGLGERISNLARDRRRAMVQAITELEVPISGDRGFAYAEATAGGIPLSEIDLGTMESKVCPGLYLCGEVCDVDGRVGGFNFQWAWSSGHVAGAAALRDFHLLG